MKKILSLLLSATMLLLCLPASAFAVNADVFSGYYMLKAETTVESFRYTVTNNGVPLNPKDFITTGNIIDINSKKYTAVVLGDVSGDGTIHSADVLKVCEHYLNLSTLDSACLIAADTNRDKIINSTDFMQIRKHCRKLFNLYSDYQIGISKDGQAVFENVPKFGWIDDDGKKYVYDYLYPWAVENQVPFMSAVITQHIEGGKSGWMSIEQVTEMYNDHPEIVSFASHTRNHINASNMKADDIHNQIWGSKNDLAIWGNIPCNIMVYPNGQVNDLIITEASKYYNCGFQASGADGSAGTRINFAPFDAPYQLKRRKLGQTSDVDLIKKEIDIAIEKNGVLIFMTHVASKDAGNTDLEKEFAVYNEVVAYIRSKGYDIEPVDDILDFYNNY